MPLLELNQCRKTYLELVGNQKITQYTGNTVLSKNYIPDFDDSNNSDDDDEWIDDEWIDNGDAGSGHYAKEQNHLSGITPAEIRNASNIYRLLISKRKSPDLSDVNDIVQLTEEQIHFFGYQPEEFILECSFDRERCYPENFTTSYNRRYGRCFTFNSGYDETEKRKPLFRTRRYGSQYGLRLTLNIDASEYVGLLAPEYGARYAKNVTQNYTVLGQLIPVNFRVLIHPSRTRPYPELDGYDAAPGAMTAFGMTHVGVERQPYPYESDCIGEYPEMVQEMVQSDGPYNYRTCQLACTDYHMVQICGCTEICSFTNGSNN